MEEATEDAMDSLEEMDGPEEVELDVGIPAVEGAVGPVGEVPLGRIRGVNQHKPKEKS